MPEDTYIADDLLTNDEYAVLSARQGYLIGLRLDAIEDTLDNLSLEIATTGEIDAIFAA
jgi:hypothetical protein